jgi:uncharacterized coiled-coil DUF342 family protein
MTPDEKIADLKTERKKLCDEFEEMKAGLESQIATLGERCNQLLKDKGNLTDELSKCKETLAQTIENDEVAYETLKLHDKEEIGMLNSKIAGLKQQIEKMKKYIKACWVEENLNDYSSYITNSSEEFRDFVKELNNEWHYVKDEGTPAKEGHYLVCLRNKDHDIFDCWIFVSDNVPYSLKVRMNDIIAWKEIVPPKEIE